jgi:hypothetical protein
MGTVGIQYDFQNHSFHAQTELYLNTPGGFLSGISEGGKAGWGVLHFDPNEWYMHLGSPSNRIGLKLSLGNIINLRVGSYLMVGSQIPAMPPPPAELAQILREDLSRLTMGRNMDQVTSGKGFAFGADFQVKTGDITFLMLYANFMAGLGFDFMFKDFGELQCRQTGSQVGINGWFAQGQAYAYLQGELGVKINLWFMKMKFPIIKGSAGTLMQAMLPHPSSFKGYLAVNVNVMGLVKGNIRFKLSVGDECDLVIPGGSPLQMAMISDLSPDKNEENMSVFTMPQATFNAMIEKPFEAENDAGFKTYRIKLKRFNIITDQGENITGTLKWNENKDVAWFQAKEILPPQATLKARVEVGFEEFAGGAWKTVYTSGKEALETMEHLFTTGSAPDNIPMQNIIHTYPVVDQQYFLTDETRTGFTQLQFGQKYLFTKGFDYKLAFLGEDNTEVPAAFKYNEGSNRLEYTVPDLANNRKYTLKIYYTPEESQGSATGGSSVATQQVVDSEEEGSLSVDSRLASAGVNTSLQKSILDYGFATSRYRTFREKVASIDTEGNGVAEDAGLSFRFLYKVRADEAFDEAEVVGVEKTTGVPLIQLYADLKEPFFTETVNPLVYNGYPFGGTIRLKERDDKVIGVPPVRSVFAYTPYLGLISGGGKPGASFYFPYSYEAGVIAERDFRDLQSQVVYNHQTVSRDVYLRFATGSLPVIKYGKYKVVMKYVLPNGTTTSSYDFYFNNFLRFNE